MDSVSGLQSGERPVPNAAEAEGRAGRAGPGLPIQGESDGALLAEFLQGRQDAFAELVRRHGALVQGVCLRTLANPHDAEDAAQATFLLLAAKARTLRSRQSLAGWLHAAAHNVARDERAARDARVRREKEVGRMTPDVLNPKAQAAWRELRPLLDAELGALPEGMREAILLHHVEGQSIAVAARQMGRPAGTVATWLSRGLARLRERLARRGTVLPAALLVLLLEHEASAAGLSVAGTQAVLAAAPAVAAQGLGTGAVLGVSPQVVAWTQGVLRTMVYTKLKVAVLILAVLTAAASAGGWYAYRTWVQRTPEAPPVTVLTSSPPEQSPPKSPKQDPPKPPENRPVPPAQVASPQAAACGLELVRASYFGTPANDDFEGAVAGPDGSLYLVGNAGASIQELPDGVAPTKFGSDVAEPLCVHGFVLKLSPDASKVLAYAELGKGILHATAIAVTDKAAYVGGYASDALEPLLKERKGLLTGYPLRTEQKLIKEGKMLEANGLPADKPDPTAGRPWLGRLGAPCVLRFSTDLKTLENGTYLEGWQQVYDKSRVCGRQKGMFREFFWQPINICPLKSGDVVVAHDGGYFRMLTDHDREAAGKLEKPEDGAELLKRLAFYDVADYVSRLSGDLTARVWKTSIYTPPTVPEVANRIKKGWTQPHFSSPRTHRMRMDKDENLWVCGWSASATSGEPWWSPFLWRLDPKTGQPTRRLYEYDPMSGGGNRMGGTVADTALLTVAVEEDGNLLTSLIADGGNSVMGCGPLGNEGKRMTGPVIGPGLGGSPAHFWGQAQRVDGKTFDGLGGARSGPWGWTIDVAGLPEKHFLALGRWNAPLPWTKDAWWTSGPQPNPNAFLRVVGPDYNTVFWTAFPGVRPFELMPIGGDRYILVGFADNGTAPMKDSLAPQAPGGEDAFFAIVKWNGKAGPRNP